MPRITFEHVHHAYRGAPSLVDVSCDIADGGRWALLGPSGAGKTTVLRLVAGLDGPTSGVIRFDGEDVAHRAPSTRGVAMVFQDDALYPHMTVRRNLDFPMRCRNVDASTRDERLRAAAERTELSALLDRRPHELSGGEQQRAALARALVVNASVWLLDEPFGHLDTRRRRRLEAMLLELHAAERPTLLFVTHDQEEAERVCEHVILLDRGRITQQGSRDELHRDDDGLFSLDSAGH